MNRYFEIFFWLAVSVILVLIFGNSAGSYIHAFYFVAFFVPIIYATSWFISSVLVPNYLLNKNYTKFILYLVYTLIISVYLLFILIFSSLVLLSYYGVYNLRSIMTDFRLMPLIMYLIVMIYGFISIVKQYLNLHSLTSEENGKRGEFIVVRSERQNRRIDCKSIIYIESMADYVRIFLDTGEKVITRTNISLLDNKLGDEYLRIHRSYIVNINKISSYTKEKIILPAKELPISRTYKDRVMKALDYESSKVSS